MKYEYLHDDGDIFVDYSWERALSIYGDVYPEWCLEFFLTMYFDKGVDRTKLMTKKCIWFRLCEVEKVLTLPEFAVLLGLKPTSTNPRTSLFKEPLMRIMYKLLVGSLVYMAGSKDMCQKRDMWMMSALEESRGINLAWVIVEHLFKYALRLKENSLICGEAPQLGQARREIQEPKGLDSSWGDWNENYNKIKHRDVWRDSMLMRNNYKLEHSTPILHHLADQSNFAYPAYEPPNVPPYPYLYVPYPHPYTHYPDTGSPSFRGDHYEAHGDGCHVGSIVPSSGYEIGGTSVRFNGEDFDLIVHSEDCVESDDDEMQD
ncbi:hypothetical protein Tco_0904994 [Tanacetum coccineum]